MSSFRIGITRDTVRDDGTPIFDPRALEIFDREHLEWEFVRENVRELTPPTQPVTTHCAC